MSNEMDDMIAKISGMQSPASEPVHNEQAQEPVARRPRDYVPPVFLRWTAKHPDWVPQENLTPEPSPCTKCKKSLWHRAKVFLDKEDDTAVDVTRAYCNVMHIISFSMTTSCDRQTLDADWVQDCDGPYQVDE